MIGRRNKTYIANASFDETVIGEHAYFYGTIEAVKSVRIDGFYSGPSLKADMVSIGKTGKVKTNIYAATVFLEGVLLGDIVASTRVLLMPNSMLVGNISAPEMITSRGVLFEGVCRVSSDMEADIGKLVREQFKQLPDHHKQMGIISDKS